MNKKLISFLAATAMIVTVSQESMALVGEAVSNGNVAIEQEKEASDVIEDTTSEDEVSDSQSTPEPNKAEDTQVNAVEVSTWAELNAEIGKANNGDVIKINADIQKSSTDKAITISGKAIKIVAQKNDGSAVTIIRDSERSTNGEFIIEGGAGLTLEGDLTIEAPNYENKIYDKGGMLTYSNFIKVKPEGNLNINAKLTAHTKDGQINGGYGKYGFISCNGNMTISDSAKISGWTIYSTENSSEQGAVVIKGSKANLVMNGGEITGNYNTGSNSVEGVSVQVSDGATFTMKNGFIKNNKKINNGTGMYGAGVLVTGKDSKFIMNNGEISGNEGRNGAGIYIKGDSVNDKAELKIDGGKIINNTKYSTGNSNDCGGGIYAQYAIVDISNAEINGNGSDKLSDNIYQSNEINGGGIYTNKCNLKIVKSKISNNKTDGNNGLGGAGICLSETYANIIETEISNNQAGDTGTKNGGGILILGEGETNLDKVDVIGNTVPFNGRVDWWQVGNGGGIAVAGKNTRVTINDSIIKNNKSGENPSDSTSTGGGLYLEEGDITIKGKTIIEENIIVDKSDDGKNNTFGTGISINEMDGRPNHMNEVNFNIEGEVQIKDDIWIGKDRIINVTGKLIDRDDKNKIEITSEEKNIEDEKTEGTKLVEYSDAAGGEAEALNATLGKYFIPSKYMNPDLKIGQSQKTKNILTYVKELPTGGGGTGGGGGTIVTPPTYPDRIEGNDRIETSVETSKDLYPNGTNAVVLANAERYTDVLTADPFAIQEKASALLTYKYEIQEKTLKEIERLGAKKIYISGGYDAVSKKVVDELAAKGYEIFRFDGVDRYDTARKIAIKIREKGNTNTAELASGEDFPDALCMTPLAVKDHAPILLTKKDSIPKYTKQALAEWDIENIKIGGLEKAVSTEVEKQLKSGFEIDKNNKKDSNVYDGAKAVKRIGGEDRYETSAKLAKESYPESKLGVYATGEDFPDALIAGNYAGTKEAPVLLVRGDSLPEPIEKYTKESKIKKATIIGGVNAVSDKVFNLIKAIINR